MCVTRNWQISNYEEIRNWAQGLFQEPLEKVNKERSARVSDTDDSRVRVWSTVHLIYRELEGRLIIYRSRFAGSLMLFCVWRRLDEQTSGNTRAPRSKESIFRLRKDSRLKNVFIYSRFTAAENNIIKKKTSSQADLLISLTPTHRTSASRAHSARPDNGRVFHCELY